MEHTDDLTLPAVDLLDPLSDSALNNCDHLDFALDDQDLDLGQDLYLPAPDFSLIPQPNERKICPLPLNKIEARPAKRRKQKGVTPIQKLTKKFRNAVRRCNAPLFPSGYALTKKNTVYIRECFQLFAQDICSNANDIPNLLSCYCEASGVYKNNGKEEALMFLLLFFTNSRQISEVVSMPNCITAQEEFTEYGITLLKRVLWHYVQRINI